jgi:beta-mannosidase
MNVAVNQFTHALDLSGQWQLAEVDGSHAALMAVPGDVHSALFVAGLIEHPYTGRNEAQVQWVAQRDWTLSRQFLVSDFADGQTWYLDVDYLDTIAEIRINGVLILNAANCFRRYRPDVSTVLKSGTNHIEITFRSNPKAADALQAQQPFYVPYSVDNCPIPNVNMLRKPQCHFGWDWNIAIAPFGLYGAIKLCRTVLTRIESVSVRQLHRDDGQVEVFVETTLHTEFGGGMTEVTTRFNGVHYTRQFEVGPGPFVVHEHFVVEAPNFWWPAGSGEQHLYQLEVQCEAQIEQRSIGLRTIELVTTPDEVGHRFAFIVNGVEIFCRGSNWIPADALPSAATPELTEKLLQAAVDSHQNMIRVWGGGFYEQDFFYELCDRLGLMVWQDFMYSCSLYPSTPEFLNEVTLEVDYQVRRLQHHACIALWCGDNELIGALNWFEVSRKDRDRYLVSYDRLNRTIETAMKTADEFANWWPSSPSPGVLSFGDAWHDDRSGDMHFWSVWHEGKDFDHYRSVKPRFCSEFGFQSFPSLQIAKQFAHPEDLNISSPVMESHQKNRGGNARIAETMFRYFRFPMAFGDFVYLSQVQQGLAIKTAVEYWRSLKPHTMGALYWQLNDTWPVASWASLDHGGGWKILHHMVKQFYQPVAVFAIPSQDGEAIRLVGVNDTREPVSIEVTLLSVGMDGMTKTLSTTNANLPTDKSVDVSWLSARDIGPERLLVFDYTASDGSHGRGQYTPVPYKRLSLVDPEISVHSEIRNGALEVTVGTSKLALFVSLETDEPGRFEEAGFDLLAGEQRTLRYIADSSADILRAQASLVVRNLYSSTGTPPLNSIASHGN